MPNLINELSILSKKKSIFNDTTIQYVIPLYQRAFAWKEKEISQLIEDIKDFSEDNYYIGSIIVSKIHNKYEVIDGQQRLTALFLLLRSLEIEGVDNTLSFACREKSNYTLHNINNLVLENMIETTLQNGKHIIDTLIKNIDKCHFLLQLRKVKIYQIEVPKNTDLNRYFEIMNTRGEQLEQHDILKAKLMSVISNDKRKELFAKVWDACSDMTGYVQMHFDTNMRYELFGQNWDRLPHISFNLGKGNKKNNGYTIKSIIEPSFKVDTTDRIADSDNRIRFESIISFPFFLLHTLKVYSTDKKVIPSNMIPSLLDDKKLIDTFDKVIKNGKINGKSIIENEERFSIDFIECLLKCRFLFDKYIIKREYINENSDGEWSLKELKTSGQRTNKTSYYLNTYFGTYGEWKTTYVPRTKINMMLQACLRVSYTSPKIMHWITILLNWLYNKKNLSELNCFETKIENIAKNAVTENYLNDKNYSLGTNTPHIVFNYLDYLLWKNRTKYFESFEDFIFEFRNTVEHWYPQNPSEGTFEKWSHSGGVNNFGNLCIIQRSTNSKFSNMIPEAKASTFKDMIAKGSLKLRLMAKIINTKSSKEWKATTFKEHEIEMLEILMSACDILKE